MINALAEALSTQTHCLKVPRANLIVGCCIDNTISFFYPLPIIPLPALRLCETNNP